MLKLFKAFVLLCQLTLVFDVGAAIEKVPLYGVFEHTITSESILQEPFDYNLSNIEAVFESAEGKVFKVSGFYDGIENGKQIWRTRFMPNKSGTWKYTIKLNAKLIKNGYFYVTDNPELVTNHGHIKVDPGNPTYLVHDDGVPHYWVGGKWFAAQNYGPERKGKYVNKRILTNNEIKSYLNLLKKYKHNGILLKVGLFLLEKDNVSWDLEWTRKAEWIIQQCMLRGINVQISFFDTWSRDKTDWFKFNTNGDEQPFNVWKDGNDRLKKNYIRYIVSRFAAYSNVYWELGNEMEHKPNNGKNFVALSNKKYIPWIRKYDPYNLPIGLSENIWQQADVDIGFLHQANELPKREWTKPVIMNEPVRYKLRLTMLQKILGKFFGKKLPNNLWSDASINNKDLRFAYRKTFWKMFTYGGSGTSEATWLDIKNEYSPALHNVMQDHMYFYDFINGFYSEINKMDPLQSIISEEPGQASTRGLSGLRYVTYIDIGAHSSVGAGSLKIKLPKGKYKAAWYKPKDGKFTPSFVINSNGNLTDIKYSGFSEDIALLVEIVK